MPAPRLPHRSTEAWECGFLFESAREVRCVSSRGGLVVAGGAELHLLRPAEQRMASRSPPLDLGVIHAAAAEPRAPWRYAVASADMVAVFFRTPEGDQILRLRCAPPGPAATHLAWGHDEAGASALYIRWEDGAVVRMKQDMTGVDTTDLPPMDAIAADNAGVLAMLSLAGPTPLAYVTRDGENLEYRSVALGTAPLPPGPRHAYLAVADTAVAVALDHGGVYLSRVPDAEFVLCEPLALAGPIDFDGTRSDAGLFGAAHFAAYTSIVHVAADGEAVRIADFGTENGPAPRITGLGWDASRDMLWGASPQMGLVTCTAPGARRGKKALVS